MTPSPRLLAAALTGAGALSAGVALTATSGWLVVRASERPVILTLLTAIVAVRTFGMARPVLRYWERLRSHDAALDDLAKQRTRLYAGLIPLTPGRLARRGRAALLGGLVDDLADRVEAQVRVTVPVIAALVTGTAATVLVGLVEPRAAVAVATLVVVAAGTTAFAWRVEARSQDELAAARAGTTRVAELAASQALELQAIRARGAASQWLRAAHVTVAAATRRQSRGRAAAAGAIPVATGLTTVACALVAAHSGRPAPVQALLVLAPFALAEVFGGLPDAARSLARAQAAGRHLDTLLDEHPAVAASRPERHPSTTAGHAAHVNGTPGPPHLRLRGLTACWDGTRPAVGPVDLDLPPGHVLAVTGPSGCGKSTVLASLARHLDPATGSYTVDGTDALARPLEEVRALFAVVDDEPHVFATTVRENLRLARPEGRDCGLLESLTRAGLADWLAGLPDGLDTLLGAGGRGLSGGERARLSIARALLSGRPVLLLDEPVAHLDHPTAVAVLHDLLANRGRRSVVIVSHRPEGLAGADGIMDLSGAALATAPG